MEGHGALQMAENKWVTVFFFTPCKRRDVHFHTKRRCGGGGLGHILDVEVEVRGENKTVEITPRYLT